MALVLPDSYHNHEVGVFQIRAVEVSVIGITIASTTQPYMNMRFRQELKQVIILRYCGEAERIRKGKAQLRTLQAGMMELRFT
ncbi:hypothetical protein E2562_024378 [Oryza meyeriana var. granulata]|uniref:Uncharacterized protein n=1 Tax=Oryza meyeriana var. granulata TaxID=110450 RepID=A0A6G1C8P4_9ORYZ|nr:hypothetical protein E2562_024378 [Oryza meyeriana var. granulata]